MFTHTGYRCTEPNCDKSFHKKSQLKRHLGEHGQNNFKCKAAGCTQSFASPADFKRHFVQAHEPKRHVCTCGCDFRRYVDLMTHRKACTPVAAVTCIVCGFVSNVEGEIKEHMALHQEPKPRVTCRFEGCTKTFSSKRYMEKHHNVVHLKLRAFACAVQGCGKSFAHKSTLVTHAAWHEAAPARAEAKAVQAERLLLDQICGHSPAQPPSPILQAPSPSAGVTIISMVPPPSAGAEEIY
jgi:general transcription factor IIIA